jgi:hypothetical protein
MRRFFAAGLAIALSLPAGASAGEDEANQLFRAGRIAMKAGDCDAALPLLSQSYELEPAIGTALNLALCEERSGKLRAAIDHFAVVTARARKDDSRRAFAAQRIAELTPRLAHLTIQAPAALPGTTEVLVDGRALDPAELAGPISLDPGLHELTLRESGRLRIREQLELREGERRTWTPRLPAPATPVAEPKAVLPQHRAHGAAEHRLESDGKSSASSGTRALGYTVGAIGAAALTASAVLGVLVLERKGVVDRNCDASGGCNADGLAAANSGKTLSRWSTVGALVGIPALGFGAYLVFTYDASGSRATQGSMPRVSFSTAAPADRGDTVW